MQSYPDVVYWRSGSITPPHEAQETTLADEHCHGLNTIQPRGAGTKFEEVGRLAARFEAELREGAELLSELENLQGRQRARSAYTEAPRRQPACPTDTAEQYDEDMDIGVDGGYTPPASPLSELQETDSGGNFKPSTSSTNSSSASVSDSDSESKNGHSSTSATNMKCKAASRPQRFTSLAIALGLGEGGLLFSYPGQSNDWRKFSCILMTEAVPLPIRQALMRWIGVPVTGEQDVGKATYASLDREALGSGGPSRSPAELSSQDMGVPSSQSEIGALSKIHESPDTLVGEELLEDPDEPPEALSAASDDSVEQLAEVNEAPSGAFDGTQNEIQPPAGTSEYTAVLQSISDFPWEFILLPLCPHCGGVPDISELLAHPDTGSTLTFVESVMLDRDRAIDFLFLKEAPCGSPECGHMARLPPYHVAWPQRRDLTVVSNRGHPLQWVMSGVIRDYLDLSVGFPSASIHGFVRGKNQHYLPSCNGAKMSREIFNVLAQEARKCIDEFQVRVYGPPTCLCCAGSRGTLVVHIDGNRKTYRWLKRKPRRQYHLDVEEIEQNWASEAYWEDFIFACPKDVGLFEKEMGPSPSDPGTKDADSNVCDGVWSAASPLTRDRPVGKVDSQGIIAVVCSHGCCLGMLDMPAGEKSIFSSYLLHRSSLLHQDVVWLSDVECMIADRVWAPFATRGKGAIPSFHIGRHRWWCTVLNCHLAHEGVIGDEFAEQFFAKISCLGLRTRHMTVFNRKDELSSFAFRHNWQMDRLINVLRGRIEEWEKKFHLAVDEFVGLWRAQMKACNGDTGEAVLPVYSLLEAIALRLKKQSKKRKDQRTFEAFMKLVHGLVRGDKSGDVLFSLREMRQLFGLKYPFIRNGEASSPEEEEITLTSTSKLFVRPSILLKMVMKDSVASLRVVTGLEAWYYELQGKINNTKSWISDACVVAKERSGPRKRLSRLKQQKSDVLDALQRFLQSELACCWWGPESTFRLRVEPLIEVMRAGLEDNPLKFIHFNPAGVLSFVTSSVSQADTGEMKSEADIPIPGLEEEEAVDINDEEPDSRFAASDTIRSTVTWNLAWAVDLLTSARKFLRRAEQLSVLEDEVLGLAESLSNLAELSPEEMLQSMEASSLGDLQSSRALFAPARARIEEAGRLELRDPISKDCSYASRDAEPEIPSARPFRCAHCHCHSRSVAKESAEATSTPRSIAHSTALASGNQDGSPQLDLPAGNGGLGVQPPPALARYVLLSPDPKAAPSTTEESYVTNETRAQPQQGPGVLRGAKALVTARKAHAAQWTKELECLYDQLTQLLTKYSILRKVLLESDTSSEPETLAKEALLQARTSPVSPQASGPQAQEAPPASDSGSRRNVELSTKSEVFLCGILNLASMVAGEMDSCRWQELYARQVRDLQGMQLPDARWVINVQHCSFPSSRTRGLGAPSPSVPQEAFLYSQVSLSMLNQFKLPAISRKRRRIQYRR